MLADAVEQKVDGRRQRPRDEKGQRDRRIGIDAEPSLDHERHVGRQEHELAVGEVDDAHGPEGQGDAERDQRIDSADEHA